MAEVGPTGLPLGTFDLKVGKSFVKSRKGHEYHTLGYDFKPKSMSGEPETFIAVDNDDVQIAIANEGKEGVTLYKGSKKPINNGKECLLIFDEATGEMRLERIASKMNVKQTRRADDDASLELRKEVERIRQKRSPKSPDSRAEAASPEKPSSAPSQSKAKRRSESGPEEADAECARPADHMSSSSESDSSSGSDSTDSSDESDAEAEHTTKRPPPPVADRLRLESSNFSSEDEAALEQHLNSAGSSAAPGRPSTPPKPAPLSSQQQVNSLFAAEKPTAKAAVAPPPPPQQKLHTPKKVDKSHQLLHNDLDLSESSDED